MSTITESQKKEVLNESQRLFVERQARIDAARALCGKTSGLASLQEYIEAEERRRAELLEEHAKRAKTSGEESDSHGRRLEHLLPPKETFPDESTHHLVEDFCEGILKSIPSSVDEWLLIETRTCLEDLIIDERKPSKRLSDAKLWREWAYDSEDDSDDAGLPFWARDDPVVRSLLAQRAESLARKRRTQPRKILQTRSSNTTGRAEKRHFSKCDGIEGESDSEEVEQSRKHKPGACIPYQTTQSTGKRKVCESDDSDESDPDIDERRVRRRMDKSTVTKPAPSWSRLKRPRDTPGAEEEKGEARILKRLRRTMIHQSSPPRQHLSTQKHVNTTAGPLARTSFLRVGRPLRPADVPKTRAHILAPAAEREVPRQLHDSQQRQKGTTKPIHTTRDVVGAPEIVETQMRALEARRTTTHALQRLKGRDREEAQGFPLHQVPANHARPVARSSPSKRKRDAVADEEEDDGGAPSATPAKRIRPTAIPHDTFSASASTKVATARIPHNRERNVALVGNADDGRPANPATGVTITPTVIVDDREDSIEQHVNEGTNIHWGPTSRPGIRHKPATQRTGNRSHSQRATNQKKGVRGAIKERVEKNPPKSIQSRSIAVGSSMKTRSSKKTEGVTPSWLRSFLETSTGTRSQKQRVFLELDARGDVATVQQGRSQRGVRPAYLRAVGVPSIKPSIAGR
ncbi:MAG: hypothetical protein Q9224_004917 [Gallowayella concinna]